MDQISSRVTSNNIYQSAGRGIRFRRVVRKIAAHARVFGGWIVYNGVRSLISVSLFLSLFSHEMKMNRKWERDGKYRRTCHSGLTSSVVLHHLQRRDLES
jgi:hypothetical protein